MKHSIEVNDLNISYDGFRVLKNVDFSFQEGSLIGVLGPNGAGKSTLIKAMLGLIHKDSGTIKIAGEDVDQVRKKIAYVPQRSHIDWDFPITVKDTVLLGTYPKLGLFRRPKKQDKERAMECLEKVGMKNYAEKQIGELSGGQQQRVFLARALAQESEFFFLDEPFVGIDVSSEEMMIRILKDLRDEGKIVLIVHHDLLKVEGYFDHLILLNKEMIKYGTVEDVFQPKYMEVAYQRPFSIPKETEEQK